LGGDATLAQRVALDGFAAITDDQLRQAIRRTTGDSTWQLPRRCAGTLAIDDVALELVGSGEGGDGDGGSDGGGD
jgi:hypothetical protein